MAAGTNILSLINGKIQALSGAGDSITISSSITAGSFSGSGAGLTGIPQSAVTNLTSDLSTLTSDVSAAQADATQALSDAAAAQSTANQAVSDAAAAQSTANGAVSDAAAAQADATQALSDAAAAQSTANQAVSDAAAAQADATQALSDAAAAQSTANQAVSDAAAAQSTANQAVSDAAAAQADASQALTDAAAAQADATQALSDAAAAQATADAAMPKAGGTFTGPVIGTDLSLSGDLVVQGTIISKQSENVLISDSFLDLNAGNTITASATAGGLTVNVKASGAAESVSAFVAGVIATSAPSFTTTASSGFAAGDIIQISGAAEAKNNGLFVVAGVSGSTVEIKGVGGTAPSGNVPFVQNQFETATSQSATATKVDLAVVAVSDGSLTKSGAVALAAGTWCYNYKAAATEALFADSWTAFNSQATPSLSDVLAVGSMIGASQEIGFVTSVESGAVKGDLLYVGSDGEFKLLSSAIADGELDGVALEAGGASKKVASVLGQKVFVSITGGAPSVGDVLYVSATAGAATKVAPTSGRIIKVGKCVGAVSSGLYPVVFQPQYLADV